jgi:hypothetical protein
MILSGFLFLLIIILITLATNRFDYEIFSDLDSDAKLQKINKNPKKFKIGNTLAFIEHGIIIALAVMLFIAFSPYNIILAVVWTISRITEGLIDVYNTNNYWGLINIARQCSVSSGAEKKGLTDLGRSILKTKNSVFSFAQIFFSFVIYGVVPPIIGWFGLVAAIIYGFGNGIRLVKPSFNALWNLGGLLILIFEAVLGGWLIYIGIIM